MTEIDAHPVDVETEIERLETPAASAGQRLAKRLRALPPGLYAVVPPDGEVRSGGTTFSDKGVHAGMRLFVSEQTLPSPSLADREALGRYAGLMYQRAPRVEAMIMEFGVIYDRAAQVALDQWLPGAQTGLSTELERRRSRMPAMARTMGDQLAHANWWAVRPPTGQAFVLSDAPVAATVALGHEDTWRPLLSPESLVIAMAIGPEVALLFAPQGIMPVSGLAGDLGGVILAINRMLWRHASRYILARHRADLEAVWPDADAGRRASVTSENDFDRVVFAAFRDTEKAVIHAKVELGPLRELRYWPRWVGCRLDFGWRELAT
jgi:hypothetical protein